MMLEKYPTLKEKSIVNMKHLNEYIKESLLDVDDFDLSRTIQIEKIKKFIDENYEVKSYTISKKPNKNGKYVVDSKETVYVKNEKLTHLTNDLFIWGSAWGDFGQVTLPYDEINSIIECWTIV